MHDLPRQKLAELVAQYGHGLCDDAKRLEGMLKDVLRNEHKREMFVLVSALREGVAAEFRHSVSGMPLSAVAAKLVRQLRDNLAFDETAARWGVESWAFALGVKITQPVVRAKKPAPPPPVIVPTSPPTANSGNGIDQAKLPREFTNSIGMRFVLIEPGEFLMGSTEADDEKPPHTVEITQPFYMGVFQVTQAEYQAVTGSNPSEFSGNAQHPVEQVSWDDAVAYCEKLNRVAGEVQRGRSYRLPTEAEWEYCCRAGSTSKFFFGDSESQLGEYAWFAGNSGQRTHPVGEKKANAWGLHDILGNVWEWCQDWYDAGYYAGSPSAEPPGPSSGSNRVLRGGGWFIAAGSARSTYRYWGSPDYRTYNRGVRLAQVPASK